jgi:hypothetical protein
MLCVFEFSGELTAGVTKSLYCHCFWLVEVVVKDVCRAPPGGGASTGYAAEADWFPCDHRWFM